MLKKFLTLIISFLLMIANTFAADSVNDWTNVKKMKQASGVTVETTNGRVFRGAIGDVWDDEIVLILDEKEVVKVPRAEVRGIWKSKEQNMKKPIMISMGIGALAGFTIGKAAESEGDRREDPGLLPLLGGGLGSGIGAVVGVVIGHATKSGKGKLVYKKE